MSLATLTPELVWGLVPRFVGFIYLLAFGALIPQHWAMPGAHHLGPVRLLRERVARDFPGVRTFFELPSLLWLSDSDAMQRGMCIVGALAGCAAIIGGPPAFYALLVAWVLWLSLEPRGLLFPWDTMLMEVGFLVMFLPTPEALPSLEASALPLPSVAFMMRWFVVRLMIGFGKDKFLQTRKDDFLFLRGFFVWMPLPNPLSWYAHHLPAWILRAGLVFMFFAEVIAPLLGLFTGTPRVIAFASLVGLMAGIQATGNWGYFNIGYALLCVCLLDTQSSIFDLQRAPWASTATAYPDVVVHVVMGLLFLVSLAYLPNNSWMSRSWVHWPKDMFAVDPKKMPRIAFIHGLLAPLRRLAPFRIVNGYGVFPPHSAPPSRMTPVLEGSADGVHWKQYGYRHMPTFPHSRPPVIAPYHARLDQWTYYVCMGMDSGSMFGSVFPMSNPYTIYTRATLFDLLAQRLIANDQRVLRMLGHNPFPDAPPKFVRVGLLVMTPTRVREMRATGQWWHIRRAGTLMPARGVEQWSERVLIPEPELFHPDLTMWKERAAPLKAITAAYARGLPPNEAIIAESDLTTADVARFWDELVPMLAEARGDWSRVHERGDLVKAHFGVEGLYRLERVLERLAWLLRQATAPHRFGDAPEKLPPMSNFRYHMVLHEAIIDGPEAFMAMMKEPVRIIARAAATSDATQLWTLTMMRYDQVWTNVRCFRAAGMGRMKRKQGFPSFFEYYDFLVQQAPAGEEFQPVFVKHPDGEFTCEGYFPPPPLTTPNDGERAARLT